MNNKPKSLDEWVGEMKKNGIYIPSRLIKITFPKLMYNLKISFLDAYSLLEKNKKIRQEDGAIIYDLTGDELWRVEEKLPRLGSSSENGDFKSIMFKYGDFFLPEKDNIKEIIELIDFYNVSSHSILPKFVVIFIFSCIERILIRLVGDNKSYGEGVVQALINEAHRKKIISEKMERDLHEVRRIRMSLVHQTKEVCDVSEDDANRVLGIFEEFLNDAKEFLVSGNIKS